MQIKTQLNDVLNKKLSRKDFLKHVAIGMVALSGAGAALRLLAKDSNPSVTNRGGGYGTSAYGGRQEGNR